MPVICWGPLAKSAQDPTTISEYIAGKVLEHNVSPSAHGLDGYSVYNHRVAPILDHSDYSIKSDKISSDWIIGKKFETAPGVGPGTDGVLFDPNGIMMYQTGKRNVNIPIAGHAEFLGDVLVNKIFYEHDIRIVDFTSLEVFDYERLEDMTNFLGSIDIVTTSTLDNINYIQAEAQAWNRIRFDKNPSFRVRFKVTTNDNKIARLVMGSFGYGLTTQYIGFWTDGTVLKALVRKTGEGGFVWTIVGIDPTEWHIYEVKYTSGSKIEFYVDGVLKQIVTIHLPIDAESSGILSVYIQTKVAATIAKILVETYTFTQEF